MLLATSLRALRTAAAANARHPASLLARHPAVLQTRSAKTRTRSNSSGILRNLRFGKNAACSSVSKRYFLVGSADGQARHFGSCSCTTTHEGGGGAPTGRLGISEAVAARQPTRVVGMPPRAGSAHCSPCFQGRGRSLRRSVCFFDQSLHIT